VTTPAGRPVPTDAVADRPRLAGPRLLLVPAPHAVALAAAGPTTRPPAAPPTAPDALRAALAPLGLVAGDGWPHPDTADALRPQAEHAGPGDPADVWLVVDGDRVVGECGLAAGLDADGDQEIGYGLAAPSRRQGLGTEAVAVLCAWVERQPGVRRVVAEVLVGNEPSRRLLARLGFRAGPAAGPYERWVRGPAARAGDATRALPRRPVRGKHVC
jgi:RimJ/RimL family protein N-acetyltransferase